MGKPSQNTHALIHSLNSSISKKQLLDYLSEQKVHPIRCEIYHNECRAFLRFTTQTEASQFQHLPFPPEYKNGGFKKKMTEPSNISSMLFLRFDEDEAYKHRDTFTEEALSKELFSLIEQKRGKNLPDSSSSLQPSINQQYPTSSNVSLPGLFAACEPDPDEPPIVLLLPAIYNNEEYSGRVEFTRDRTGEDVYLSLFIYILIVPVSIDNSSFFFFVFFLSVLVS